MYSLTTNTVKATTMPNDSPLVIVVDDDISIRESLELLIRSVGWQPELYECAKDFLSRQPINQPACLILDVNLPDLSGLEIQENVSINRAELPIIFLTGYGDVAMTVKAMKAGAVEFLTKPFSDEVLIGAIESALERSRLSLAEHVGLRALRSRFDTLTPREHQVMALIVRGLLNKQVAYELGISEITVKAHRGQMMRKMKARSLPDLVNMAAQLGPAAIDDIGARPLHADISA